MKAALSAYSFHVFGDLRDFDTSEDDELKILESWFGKTCVRAGVVRQAFMQVDCEGEDIQRLYVWNEFEMSKMTTKKNKY